MQFRDKAFPSSVQISASPSSESVASPVFGSRNGVSTDIKNAHSSSIMDKPEKCRTLVPDSDRYPGFQLREASDGSNPLYFYREIDSGKIRLKFSDKIFN